MATAPEKLSYEQFQREYGEADRAYEFWYGKAVAKGMPTWIHGLLQKIIMALLDEEGFISASEVELRIEAGAYPRPDVVGSRTLPKGAYPLVGLDVVVEIVSEDDKYPLVTERCGKYQAWGFGAIYIVNPADRSVVEWRDGGTVVCSEFAGIPVERIWKALDAQYAAS